MKSDFGKLFQLALERNGYSQKTAAELLHVTPQTIHAYITGRSVPNIEIFDDMMKYFGIDMMEVFDPLEREDFNRDKIREIATSLNAQQILLLKGILLYFHAINTSKV